MNKSSIDEVELNKFNKTAAEWWDEKGEFCTLHQINPVRIEYITEKIKDHYKLNNEDLSELPLKDLNLLDIGCGGGLFSVPMHKLGANVTGLDANRYNIKAANEYAKNNDFDIKFINTTVEEHISYNIQYNVVVCLEVIEHVANQAEFVQNLTKLIAPGGLLVLSTLNRTIKSFALAIVMAEYVLGWVPKNTHQYSNFLKPSELANILAPTNFYLRALKGLNLELTSQKWKLSDDIGVNYFAIIS